MQKRSFSKKFKLHVLQELQSGKNISEICREHELKSTLVCRWRREYEKNPQHAFNGKGNPSREDTKIAKLERTIGQLYLQLDFVKKVNNNLQARLTELKKTR